jgi:hypothetical protein
VTHPCAKTHAQPPGGQDKKTAKSRPVAKPKAKPPATLPESPTHQQLQEALERAGCFMNAIASHVDGLPLKTRLCRADTV